MVKKPSAVCVCECALESLSVVSSEHLKAGQKLEWFMSRSRGCSCYITRIVFAQCGKMHTTGRREDQGSTAWCSIGTKLRKLICTTELPMDPDNTFIKKIK